MKYIIKKETKPTLATFGKYKAVASHHHTIGHDQIIEECCRPGIFTADIVEPVLIRLSDVINRHLRNGDKVKIKDFGMMKLEIESEKVDDPKTFRAKKHIRGVRLHFLPESYEGTQALYDGITFEKDKTFKEE